MYIVKITVIMVYRGNTIQNPNIIPREIAYFRKFAKMYTSVNIYVYSIRNVHTIYCNLMEL